MKYLAFALTGFILLSCDADEFLNPLPDTAVSVDGFFNSDDDIVAGLSGIYDAIQGVNENTQSSNSGYNRGVQFEYLLTEHRSDNTRSKTLEGSRADFHRHVVLSQNIQSEDYYQSMYEIIFRSNTVIAYVDKADEANVAKYTAEAQFLRAYAYFNLLRLYGGVPLVTGVVGPEDHEALFTRATVDAVYAQIETDFTAAIAVLDNSSKSRASKAAAEGLLAKAYLTRQADGDYDKAKALCESIINSGDYGLESDFNNVFYDELNDEVIFVVEYIFGDPAESQGFSSEFTSTVRQGRQDGLNIVNAGLRAAFDASEGDKRKAVSYVTFGETDEAVSEVAKFLPEGSVIALKEGTNIVDGTPAYGDNSGSAGNDWIVLRYADVLLMHAEAITKGGKENGANADALSSVNKVRARAGLANLASVNQESLLLERRLELAFENQRFFDLLRFGVANDVLVDNATNQDDDGDGTVNGYTAYSVLKLLLPIPSREINLSNSTPTKLEQNPGY